MNIHRWRSISILVSFLFLLWPIVASGANSADTELLKNLMTDKPNQSVSLKQAIKLALKQNHSLKATSSSLAAKKEDIGIAKSYLLPKISVEERFMRTNNPTYGFMAKLNQERFTMADFAIDALNDPAPISDFQTSFTVELPLFVPQLNIGHEMSQLEYSAEKETFLRQQEQVAFDVARTYIMVITAAEYVAVSKRAVADTKEHLRIAQLRYENNLGLLSDTLRASTAVAEAEQKLVSSQKNHLIAQKALGLLLGQTESISVSNFYPQIRVHDIEYYNRFGLARADVKALELQHQNAENNLRLAKSEHLPTLGIGSSYQFNDHYKPFGSEGESWQVGGFLKWRLFDGLKRGHEKSKAIHQIAEVDEYLNGMKKAVLFKIHEAYLAVAEAKKNTELAESAYKTAEEGVRLIKVRYENSLSPIVDLLDAQVAHDQTKAGKTARNNEYRLAIMNLSYESGTLFQDLDIKNNHPEDQ